MEPNPNPPTLPPNGELVNVVVAPPKPANEDGFVEAAPVCAVVVKLLPNANEAVLVIGFVDDPKGSIFLKILISEFN